MNKELWWPILLPSANRPERMRDFAAKEGIDESAAFSKGIERKAKEFVKKGAEIYNKV